MTPAIVSAVRRFVEVEVRPAAAALEHADAYPHTLVARLRDLGLFGALIPPAHGGLGLDVLTYARVVEELCRGWMSLAGVVNSHTMLTLIVLHHGTEAQRRRFLHRLASGEVRGGLCLTEPHAGSDVQAIRTTARRAGELYVLDGSKMFVTNGREGQAFAVLAVTDPGAHPRHRGMSCFVVEKGHPGFRVVKSLAKLGYKGVDTAELLFEGCEVPATNLVGEAEGRGFGQVMSGLETGRINIAARSVGVAQAIWEEARQRAVATGAAPAALADLAGRVEASRLITYWAAGLKDRRERCDLEAGMAKLFAAHEAALTALRLYGEAGTLERHTVERHYRDTPLMIIGEGTNEIQRTLIARQLVERHGERPGALTSREGEPDERRELVLAVRRFVDRAVVPAAVEHDAAARYPRAHARAGRHGRTGRRRRPRRGRAGPRPQDHGDAGRGARPRLDDARRSRGRSPRRHVGAGAPGPARDAGGVAPATGARGERLATTSLGRPVAAHTDGGGWTLDGTTAMADNAPRADLYLLAAADGTGQPLLALVGREAEGLVVEPPEKTLGSRGLHPCVLRMDGVRPERVWAGPDPAAQVLSAACVLAAATAVGVAQAAFEAALRYSQQRTTFGQLLWQHQAVQLKLADMATGITAARLLTYAAAGETTAPPDPARAIMARLQATPVAVGATLESMRIHGGYGYVREFPVERYYRDATRLLFVPQDDETLRAHLAARLVAPGAGGDD